MFFACAAVFTGSSKNYPAALKDLDKVIASEPSSIAYKERADLHVRMGHLEKSKADLAAARKILE
jgi:hypothetical protein